MNILCKPMVKFKDGVYELSFSANKVIYKKIKEISHNLENKCKDEVLFYFENKEIKYLNKSDYKNKPYYRELINCIENHPIEPIIFMSKELLEKLNNYK